jgi:hypothetical protein
MITGFKNAEYPFFWVLQSHNMPGFIVMSCFYSLFCGLFFIVYISRAMLFESTIKGKFLAAWVLEGNDWDTFKESESDQEVKSVTKMAIIVALALIVLALIIVAIDQPRNTGLFLEIIFSIAIFIVMFAFIRQYFYSQNLKLNYGLIYLNEQVLIYNNFMHQFKGMGTRLDAIEAIEDGGKSVLGVCYSYRTKTGWISRTVFVPIPITEFKRFEELADFIKSKKLNRNSQFNKIDLIGSKVNLAEVKPYIYKILTAIVISCCISFFGAYFLVNHYLGEYKVMLKEQKIREAKLKKRVLDYNIKLYSNLPESARDYKKSHSFIWDYNYQSEGSEFVLTEILEDGNLILGNDKFDGTTEIRRLDNYGKELWKKAFSRVHSNLTYFSNEILKLGNNLCFISLYPDYEGVLLKLQTIDFNGNSKGIIDVKIDSAGSLKYPEFFKRDNESFIYHAICEDDGKNFIAIINKDGKIIAKRKIGDAAERDGAYYGWGDASNLFHVENNLIQAYKNQINIYDSDGKLIKQMSIKKSEIIELKNPLYDSNGNLLFFNSNHSSELSDVNRTENRFYRESQAFLNQVYDSLNIIKISKNGVVEFNQNFGIRKNRDIKVKYLSDNKFILISTAQTDLAEFSKIMAVIYYENNNSMKEELYGCENNNLELIEVTQQDYNLFIIARKKGNKYKNSKEIVVIKIK